MPSNDERWLDAEAGPVVRPYALTQGRTRHAGESFDLVATVMATPAALTEQAALAPEHMSVLQLARAPTTVADIASDVDLPLGVVRIILADLRELGGRLADVVEDRLLWNITQVRVLEDYIEGGDRLGQLVFGNLYRGQLAAHEVVPGFGVR